MESSEQGYEDDRFQSHVSRNLHCAICLNVFKDPVMCQRNQHCFCRPCIGRHLRNSLTCPTCTEELTLETLNEAPRILTDCLSELNIRCEYSNRGCRKFVQLGYLETHVKNCGFSPVVCSNQGCVVEINKRDQAYHESEICEFRRVKCHDCGELRKNLDEMKMDMTTLTEKLGGLERNQAAMNNKMQEMTMNQTIVNNEMRDVKMGQTVVNKELREVKLNLTAVNDAMDEMRMNLREIKDQLKTVTDQMVHNINVAKEKTMDKTQETGSELGKMPNVVIAGGHSGTRRLYSVEKFSLTNKSWSLMHPMQHRREHASSFVYRNQMIVNGGYIGCSDTDTMERVNIKPVMGAKPSSDFPAELPTKLHGHSSLVYGERLLIVGGSDGSKLCDSIHEVLLMPPHTSKLLTTMPQARGNHGAQLFNDKILICGGRKSGYNDVVDSVIMYDITKNECKQMSPLPYAVCRMATVSWGDNVIVIGGAGNDDKPLNTVVIYNVKTEKSHMLPAMKCKRKGCVAVVVDSTIVVMGGIDERGNHLRSVESFSFDRYAWVDLPSMSVGRLWSTAVVV